MFVVVVVVVVVVFIIVFVLLFLLLGCSDKHASQTSVKIIINKHFLILLLLRNRVKVEVLHHMKY